MAYNQNDSNTCCFSSLTSDFTAPGERNSEREIAMQIEEYLHCKYQGYKDGIEFANIIMSPHD